MNNEIKITQSFTEDQLIEIFNRMTAIVAEGTDTTSALHYALFDMGQRWPGPNGRDIK